jgi:hypothetical protein
MLFRIEGADVAVAGSGHEALTIFLSRHVDVVVRIHDILWRCADRTRRASKLSSSPVKASARAL